MDHPLAEPKWSLPEGGIAARLTREAVLARVSENIRRLGVRSWSEAASGRQAELFGARDGAELSRVIFEEFQRTAGRKYFAACEMALRDLPERYVLRPAGGPGPAAAELPPGVIGAGDNVFETDDVTGKVMIVRRVKDVDELIREGVPQGTIAVIDDAGGTMTAPVLVDFAGVICLAGSVRSHLAIIAREFCVPTLMGARLRRPLQPGETVTVTYSVPAQSVEAYFAEDLGPRAEIRAAPRR